MNASLLRKAAELSAQRKKRVQRSAERDEATNAAQARALAEREEKRRRQVEQMLGDLGGTPPVVQKKVAKDDGRRQREEPREKVKERERKQQPRPSTESIVVEARPAKATAPESSSRPKDSHRVERTSHDDADRRRERARDAERRTKTSVESPRSEVAPRIDRPTSSSRPEAAAPQAGQQQGGCCGDPRRHLRRYASGRFGLKESEWSTDCFAARWPWHDSQRTDRRCQAIL